MKTIHKDTREHMDTIEAVIDRSSLEYVLNVIAQICYEKSDHVLTNWQNRALANNWERCGSKVDALADKLGMDYGL